MISTCAPVPPQVVSLPRSSAVDWRPVAKRLRLDQPAAAVEARRIEGKRSPDQPGCCTAMPRTTDAEERSAMPPSAAPAGLPGELP